MSGRLAIVISLTFSMSALSSKVSSSRNSDGSPDACNASADSTAMIQSSLQRMSNAKATATSSEDGGAQEESGVGANVSRFARALLSTRGRSQREDQAEGGFVHRMWCTLMTKACSTIFGDAEKKVSDEMCNDDSAEAASVCQAIGLGPEDPFADACTAAFAAGIEAACRKVVASASNFGATECEKAVGCACGSKTCDGDPCPNGEDDKCTTNTACARYNNEDVFQCCASYEVIEGVAWCSFQQSDQCYDGLDDTCNSTLSCARYDDNTSNYQCAMGIKVQDDVEWMANPERGACSEGNDNNCAEGLVCGRYSSDTSVFQCCSNSQVLSDVAWCTNSEGSACSDGNDDNCDDNLVCGRYQNDASSYQCCQQFQDVSGVVWCANSEGGACSDGNDDNCLGSSLICGRNSATSDTYQCCQDYQFENGVAWCSGQ